MEEWGQAWPRKETEGFRDRDFGKIEIGSPGDRKEKKVLARAPQTICGGKPPGFSFFNPLGPRPL